MLHLIFCENGLNRVRELLRPTDQIVQFQDDNIILLDSAKYLNSQYNIIEGKNIDNKTLANLIENATSIKSTY